MVYINFQNLKKREYDGETCAIFGNNMDGKQISIPINELLNTFTKNVFIINHNMLGLSYPNFTVEDVVSHISKMAMVNGYLDGSVMDVNFSKIVSCYALMNSFNSLNAHYETNDNNYNLGDNYSVVPIVFGNILEKAKTYSDNDCMKKKKDFYENNLYLDYENTVNNKENKDSKKMKL